MSTWKAGKDKATDAAARKQPPIETEVQVWPVPEVEVTNLELVMDDEPGCDPYNSTGEHLLEKIRRYDD